MRSSPYSLTDAVNRARREQARKAALSRRNGGLAVVPEKQPEIQVTVLEESLRDDIYCDFSDLLESQCGHCRGVVVDEEVMEAMRP